jgi:hypothetical protein
MTVVGLGTVKCILWYDAVSLTVVTLFFFLQENDRASLGFETFRSCHVQPRGRLLT